MLLLSDTPPFLRGRRSQKLRCLPVRLLGYDLCPGPDPLPEQAIPKVLLLHHLPSPRAFRQELRQRSILQLQ